MLERYDELDGFLWFFSQGFCVVLFSKELNVVFTQLIVKTCTVSRENSVNCFVKFYSNDERSQTCVVVTKSENWKMIIMKVFEIMSKQVL